MDQPRPRAIALLGGTFDPPHRGHLELARAALSSGRVGEVMWVPAASPPHKSRNDMNTAEERLAMLRLFLAGEPGMSVNPLELNRNGPSFTIDTVRELRRQHPEVSWHLLIGSDMALSFGQWREAKELLALAPPLWAERPDFPWPDDPNDLSTEPGLAKLTNAERAILSDGRIGMIPQPISSTWLREALHNGDYSTELRQWLSPGLIKHIRTHNLYR